MSNAHTISKGRMIPNATVDLLCSESQGFVLDATYVIPLFANTDGEVHLKLNELYIIIGKYDRKFCDLFTQHINVCKIDKLCDKLRPMINQ